MRELIKIFIAVAFVLASFFIGKSMEEEKQSKLNAQLNAKLKVTEQTIMESSNEIKELKQIIADYKKKQQKVVPTSIKLKKSTLNFSKH